VSYLLFSVNGESIALLNPSQPYINHSLDTVFSNNDPHFGFEFVQNLMEDILDQHTRPFSSWILNP